MNECIYICVCVCVCVRNLVVANYGNCVIVKVCMYTIYMHIIFVCIYMYA